MAGLAARTDEGFRREAARALRARRAAAGEAFARGFERGRRWQELSRGNPHDRAEYVEVHFAALVDYLAEFLERDDPTFRSLFIGESVKALYEPAHDGVAARTLAVEVLSEQRRQLHQALDGALSAQGWAALEERLLDIDRVLTAETPRTQRVLLVGDCLFLDIVPFIVAELMEAGVRLVAEYVTSKNPSALAEELRQLGETRFDVVFFSPFSYEFSPAYAQLAGWRQARASRAEVRAVVDRTWDDARAAIDLLADLFDCPIHVHNSAAVIRDERPLRRLLKLWATARVRAFARGEINRRLADHLEARNARALRHLFLVDEARLVRAAGESAAGAYFYKTALQHPAGLGRILAGEYVDILVVNAWLATRKLVVCDLDNTLWDGLIGEGEVAHFHDRQRVLQSLRGKGVVLAICSKNDPAKVHWRGATLSDDDCVFAAVGWEPKVQGMRRILEGLNLRARDCVFVDDREDERELMRLGQPDVLGLDATRPSTWRRLALWSRMLDPDPGMDRTLMYKQREQRKAVVLEDGAAGPELATLFGSLGLRLTIAPAAAADLKRIAELINRTNQFNLEGSRVTYREVAQWHQSPDHLIVVGQAADRFGDLGTSCVAALRFDGAAATLLPFVLSCRVFGYGIEHGVMNYLREAARRRGSHTLVGRYVPTLHNAPCKTFLADNGFVEEGGRWVAAVGHAGLASPDWLQVVATH